MQIQAYFENIQQEIIIHIKKAQSSVFIAVAWLTDYMIFNILCEKAKQGVFIDLLLLNDEINNEKTSIDHEELVKYGGSVHFVNPGNDGAIMHHKFCVIDNCTVITGSYNWSRQATRNNENIVISTDACDLGTQFIKEFEAIKYRCTGLKNEPLFIDIATIVKRLQVIKTFAALEDKEDINVQIKKLKEQNLPDEVSIIVRKLELLDFGDALRLVDVFISLNNRITVYEDAELFGLLLEIKSYEIQLNALENEKVEIEKLIHEFLIRHTHELGALIIELLALRKLNAETDDEREEAANDEKQYKEGYEANKDKQIPELTKDEKQKLTKMYREASMLCHPDKFTNESPEKQKQAEELFKQLAEAYSNNNAAIVAELLHNLQNGVLTLSTEHNTNKKAVQKARLESLKAKAIKLNQLINELKLSETYCTATQNSNWDEYFESAKIRLQEQILEIKDNTK